VRLLSSRHKQVYEALCSLSQLKISDTSFNYLLKMTVQYSRNQETCSSVKLFMRLWLGVTGAKLVLSSQNLMLILSSLGQSFP
jgi:hypothetical protein